MTAGLSRRGFLAGTAALVGAGGRVQVALGAQGGGHTVVLVELDGGLDGLSAVVPAGDRAYYDRRPRTAVPDDRVLPLDGRFGLHPALGALHALWQQGMLAVVPAVGSPGGTRSHFTEQSLLARCVPLGSGEPTGWLARHLHSRPAATLRGVAMSAAPSPMLAGDELSLSIADLRGAAPRVADGPERSKVETALRGAYTDGSTWSSASAVGAEALRLLRDTDADSLAPRAGSYGEDVWSLHLRQVAQLLHAGIPVEAAVVRLEGWDTHFAMGAWNDGRLTTLLRSLGTALGAFAADVSDLLDRMTIVVVSEFGRRLAENASGGTDHGHGGIALVLGGGILGGVHGPWPGLADAALDQGDVAAATDVRSVFATVVARRLGNPDLGAVFPGWSGPLLGFA